MRVFEFEFTDLPIHFVAFFNVVNAPKQFQTGLIFNCALISASAICWRI